MSARRYQTFIHLRSHTNYSLLEGAIRCDRLIDLAKADKQPAAGICDTNNLFGALEFSEKASKAGVQPIIALQIAVRFESAPPASHRQTRAMKPHQYAEPALVLVAQNEAGFQSLMRVASLAYEEEAPVEPLNGASQGPGISIDDLSQNADGLLCLTGGAFGPVGSALWNDDVTLAKTSLSALKQVFPDRLYVELQRHGLEQEEATEAGLIGLAYEFELPLVATNENYFPSADDYEAHDALLAIAESRLISDEDRRRLTPTHAFASAREMGERFSDLPEALDSTVEIAMRCHYRPQTSQPLLPRFTKAEKGVDQLASESRQLRQMAKEGLEERLRQHGTAEGHDEAAYFDRLEFELSIIERMEFPGYFLIVADFIQWAKRQHIPVGPGRGSGAGSVVAWALTITDLDPLQFGLLFERFLNPERISMPDFDIDFCQDRRDEVIAYVQDRYGHDRVAQIITFGTLQARAVLRDVGRVLEMPYGQVDRLCKLVPANPADPFTLERALKEVDALSAARQEPIIDKLIGLSLRLEGLHRHASTHAAGVVIADRPLTELVPVYKEAGSSMPVTQYSMKWVEPAGLVKFDFLGLKTLTIIQETIRLLSQRGVKLDIATIPLDDGAAYALYARADTMGVFQVESGGMRRTLLSLRPDRFEDIIALVALFRPGPMDNIPKFASVKHGRETADYIHPLLEHALKETYGIIVYQEQVMEIARILSGYSLGEADMLRRAMGKKIRSEMQKQKARFVEGAVDRGLDAPLISDIFEKVAKFADYGFNKSHAAAYALVSYQTAFLKANYPAEFLAASMSYDISNTEKLAAFRQDALARDVEVRSPDINAGGAQFQVSNGGIDYALCAIKGVGEGVADHICQVRDTDGPFGSIEDFASRINPKIIGRRALENMIGAGAFDGIVPSRARLMASVDRLLAEANRSHEDQVFGQAGLFGGDLKLPDNILAAAEEWSLATRLQREMDTLGFFFSAHPLDDYDHILRQQSVLTIADVDALIGLDAENIGATTSEDEAELVGVKVAGTVVEYYERRTRAGRSIGIIKLTDATGPYEVAVFEEGLETVRAVAKPGVSLLIDASARSNEGERRLQLRRLQALEDVRPSQHRTLSIYLSDQGAVGALEDLIRLGATKQTNEEGGVVLIVRDPGNQRQIELSLPGTFNVGSGVLQALRSLSASGVEHAELHG
ncbi:MAG: DNA polymerase III subunit alpha [Pseudomonadota bacterium]